MDRKELASYIDATIVKNNNTFDDVNNLASFVRINGMATAFTLPCYTEYMAELLADCSVNVGTTVGFPWGGECSETKAMEAARYIQLGADEIDMVINLGYLFSERYNLVLNDIKQVRDVVPDDKILKCIVESPMLTDEQIKTVTGIVIDSGADFIKTATGFHGKTELRDVEIMSNVAKGAIKIKAAGGIRTSEDAEAFINAGACRLGIGFESADKIISSME